MSSSLCAKDQVPLALHARCWACSALAGPGHDAGQLVMGLCSFCRADLAESVCPEIERTPRHRVAPSSGRLVAVKEAAVIAGVSDDTVRHWLADGRLRRHELPHKIGSDPRGRRIRIDEHELRRLIKVEDLTAADLPPNSA